MTPLVSPFKTLQGLVGGGLNATLIGGCLFWLTPFGYFESLLISFVMVTLGCLGGLAMSAIKRSLRAKDWGTLIKGTAACSIAWIRCALRHPSSSI